MIVWAARPIPLLLFAVLKFTCVGEGSSNSCQWTIVISFEVTNEHWHRNSWHSLVLQYLVISLLSYTTTLATCSRQTAPEQCWVSPHKWPLPMSLLYCVPYMIKSRYLVLQRQEFSVVRLRIAVYSVASCVRLGLFTCVQTSHTKCNHRWCWFTSMVCHY